MGLTGPGGAPKGQQANKMEIQAENRISNTRRALFFLGSTHFLIHVFSQLIPAIIPILRDEQGISLYQASLLVSIPLLVQVVFYLPAGAFSDRNSALVLAMSFISTGAGAYLAINASGYMCLLMAFVMIALGSTLYHPPALKATSEISPEKTSLAMGIQNAGGSLGYSAGPIVLGLLMPVLGWRMAFLVWIPFILAAAGYSYFYLSRRQITQTGRASGRSSYLSILTKGFVLIVLMGAFTDATFINVSTYLTTYLTDVRGITAGLASIIFGLGPLTGIIGSIGGGLSGDIIGKEQAFLALLVLMAASLILIPSMSSLLLVSLLYVVWRGLYSASMPLMNSFIAKNSGIEVRSLSFSVYFITSNLMGAITPTIGAHIVEDFGVSTIFPSAVITLLPSMAIVLYIRRFKE